MSRPLAIIIWSIAIITVGLFAWPKWRLPESVSAHSAAIDHQFKITLIVIGVGFALTHSALGYARVEIVLAAITGVIFIALAITGQRVWAQLRLNQAAPMTPMDAVQVEA